MVLLLEIGFRQSNDLTDKARRFKQHLSQTPGSPRSGAKGKSGVYCSTAAFPPEHNEGGNDRNNLDKKCLSIFCQR
jgi:hypothetical protein